uniref:Uncharacterized protein n=1 Tax=Megaselia scalaris TaxID=36166 RepID=T1GBI9_MEGSC
MYTFIGNCIGLLTGLQTSIPNLVNNLLRNPAQQVELCDNSSRFPLECLDPKYSLFLNSHDIVCGSITYNA